MIQIMIRLVKIMVVAFIMLLSMPREASCQAIKTNVPYLLLGIPNIGAEFSISKKISISGDILWAPYLFKKDDQVLRSLQGSIEMRYYINPKYYYTNNTYDGFYIGPYVLAGDFNVGLKTKDNPLDNFRREGWGISAGVSLGYKMYLSNRFRVDFNLCLGYAQMQYDKYYLGGEWSNYPLEMNKTKSWFGPTKVGISLVYNLFK